jgi:hypothetical protein
MALVALRLGPLNPSPRRHWSRSRCRIAASNATAAAVVWFKHDLRIDDHPGLVAAAAEPRRLVVPLYVFDHRILAGKLLALSTASSTYAQDWVGNHAWWTNGDGSLCMSGVRLMVLCTVPPPDVVNFTSMFSSNAEQIEAEYWS